MLNLEIKIYLRLIFIISLISIISAYFIEYILGHQPCNLCLIERIPYGLSVILVMIIYIFKKHEKFFILLFALIFIFSFMISIYHFGIEQGLVPESDTCKYNNSLLLTKDDILKSFQEITISCKDVALKIFGF